MKATHRIKSNTVPSNLRGKEGIIVKRSEDSNVVYIQIIEDGLPKTYKYLMKELEEINGH